MPYNTFNTTTTGVTIIDNNNNDVRLRAVISTTPLRYTQASVKTIIDTTFKELISTPTSVLSAMQSKLADLESVNASTAAEKAVLDDKVATLQREIEILKQLNVTITPSAIPHIFQENINGAVRATKSGIVLLSKNRTARALLQRTDANFIIETGQFDHLGNPVPGVVPKLTWSDGWDGYVTNNQQITKEDPSYPFDSNKPRVGLPYMDLDSRSRIGDQRVVHFTMGRAPNYADVLSWRVNFDIRIPIDDDKTTRLELDDNGNLHLYANETILWSTAGQKRNTVIGNKTAQIYDNVALTTYKLAPSKFGDLPALAGSKPKPVDLPDGYVWYGPEGSTIYAQYTKYDLAYRSSNGKTAYKLNVGGTSTAAVYTFDNATFGDPDVGVTKEAYFKPYI